MGFTEENMRVFEAEYGKLLSLDFDAILRMPESNYNKIDKRVILGAEIIKEGNSIICILNMIKGRFVLPDIVFYKGFKIDRKTDSRYELSHSEVGNIIYRD